MERALEIAAQVPEADLGLVEVRPTMDLSTFDRQRRQSGREVGDPSGARQLRCDVARSRR
jgi:hypothetical protein